VDTKTLSKKKIKKNVKGGTKGKTKRRTNGETPWLVRKSTVVRGGPRRIPLRLESRCCLTTVRERERFKGSVSGRVKKTQEYQPPNGKKRNIQNAFLKTNLF